MSSNPSDVLATVFLWVCFCILSSITYLTLAGGEKPTAPQITISHHSVEPQVVVPPPLWSFNLPPPREPQQPAFELRPESESLPRRTGLIPRAERRVRPAVLPERHVQRKRHMTEMSTRERVAVADKEAAKEAYEAHKEQDLLWRSKAISHEEAEAECKQEAASGTGGERKQLGIDLEAAKSRPSNAQNIEIERPTYEDSNAFTGTALGDKNGTAYAPPMDIEEAGTAVTCTRKQDYPQTAVASGSGTDPKDRHVRQQVNVPESPALEPQVKLPRYKVVRLPSEQFVTQSFALAGGAQGSDYTAATDAADVAIVPEEPINTDSINFPVNPLLGLPAGQAWEMLTSWLSEADSTSRTLTPDEVEAWYQMLILLFTYWWQWMGSEDIRIWKHIGPCKVIGLAKVASGAHDLINERYGTVTNEAKMVCERMGEARQVAETEEQARIDEEARQQFILRAQMQQQELARKLQVEKQEEQARIIEEQKQELIHMPQPPVGEGDEDLYGNDARGEESQQAFMAARKMELANAESVAAIETKPEVVHAREQKFEADSRMDEDCQNIQADPAVQQQPTVEAAEPRKQAPASSATIQQPSRAPVGLSQSRWNTPQELLSVSVPDNRNNAPFVQATAQKLGGDSRVTVEGQNAQPDSTVQQHPVTEATNSMQQASTSSDVIGKPPPTPTTGVLRRLENTRQNNGRNGRRQRRNGDRPQPVVEAPKPPSPLGAREMFTASIKGVDSQWLTPHETTEALDMNWTYQDIDPNGNHHPLSTSKSDEANLVLIKTWLDQNNDCVDDLGRRLQAPQFADINEIEQYMLLFDQNGVKPKIKQMSDRYLQLRDHACIQCGNTQVFEWQDYVISPDEIRTTGLKTLAEKDLRFLSDMRNALRHASESKDDVSPDKPDYKLLFEAYEIALSVSRSMKHITAPDQISVPMSGPLAGDDSDLSDCDDPADGST